MAGRLGDGARCADEHRVGAVVPAESPQSPQHRSHVGAEHAAVAVGLVDHHVTQRTQETLPTVVARQHRAVQHVGIGQHERGEVAGEPPFLGLGVAVEGGEPPRLAAELTGPPSLVVGQRLGRCEVQGGVGAGRRCPTMHCNVVPDRALGGGGVDRQQVSQRLTRSRRGTDRDVSAFEGRRGGHSLMLPQRGDALFGQRRTRAGGYPRGHLGGEPRTRRPMMHVPHLGCVRDPLGHGHALRVPRSADRSAREYARRSTAFRSAQALRS